MRTYICRLTGYFVAFLMASSGYAEPATGIQTVLVTCVSNTPKIAVSQDVCDLFTISLQDNLGVETTSDSDAAYDTSYLLSVHSMSPRALSVSLLFDDGNERRSAGPIGTMLSGGILQRDRVARLFDDLVSDI